MTSKNINKTVYYNDESFALYDFGQGHPFSPVRQQLTIDLLKKAELLNRESIISPPNIDHDTLLLFHTPDYIDAVKRASEYGNTTSESLYGIGSSDTPAFHNMHRAAKTRVAATVDAAHRVITKSVDHAANFAGGLHHAMPDRAAGFCVYNDAGVAIASLRKHYNARVAYIDIDAHHGDGVQYGFNDDPNVLTISIHENPETLFPGTGYVDEIGEGIAKGTSVNIPLLASTDGDDWLACFELVVPDVVRAFKPDIIISQHGADAHRLDPLSHLCVSTDTLTRAAQMLHHLAHELCDGKWVALGGGGYAIWQVVPRAWSLVWAVMNEHDPNGHLPAPWRERWRDAAPIDLPTHWYDPIDNEPIKDAADFDGDFRRTQNLSVARKAKEVALSYLL